MSGRPGSNRPPRPWQGRALPNELLPRDIKELYFFRTAKIRDVFQKKQTYLYFGLYKVLSGTFTSGFPL